jgi:hypothetical protein
MIGTDQVVNGVWVATVLLLLGLVPGLYHSLLDGISNISNLVAVRIPNPRFSQRTPVNQPYWFAAAGMIVLLLTVTAYLF